VESIWLADSMANVKSGENVRYLVRRGIINPFANLIF
jgi:hypothetical protein